VLKNDSLKFILCDQSGPILHETGFRP